MDKILPPVYLEDENTEEGVAPPNIDPLNTIGQAPHDNMDQALQDFRDEWQQELQRSKGQGHSRPKVMTNEEKAVELFLEGTKCEQNGDLYPAIEYYRKAIRLDPDVESKIDFRTVRTPRDRQDSECSVESNKEEEEDLLLALQEMKLEDHMICQMNTPQSMLHISQLPIEVLMYIIRWLVSSDLDVRSLEMFSQVCRGFYVLARDEEIWKSICVRVWNQKCGKVKKYGTWRRMYIERPHLLFNGCYINKVTYYRPGEHSVDGFYQPFHVVNYYRLIRLYPDGTILMNCSPEEPQVSIAELKSKHTQSNSVLKGRYIQNGDKVSAELENTKRKQTSNNYYKYKRRQRNQNIIDISYYIELEISSAGRGIHNVLTWKNYTITSHYRSSNTSTISQIPITKKAFPQMVFSRVRSFTSHSESPL